MIDKVYVFEDVISIEDQMEILDFIENTDLEWTFERNITGQYGKNGEKYFPANVLPKVKLKNHPIDSTISRIQNSVIQKLNLIFVENYRYKINWTKPLDSDYNPMDLLHIDNQVQHIAMIYYANDSTGDTHIYDNEEGNNAEVHYKYIDHQIDHSKLKLTNKISPKMGRVVVFDGRLYHHAEYPKRGNRYIINFNFVAKKKTESLI